MTEVVTEGQITELAHKVEHGDGAALSQFFAGMSRIDQLKYGLQLQEISRSDISKADPETAKHLQPIMVRSAGDDAGILEIWLGNTNDLKQDASNGWMGGVSNAKTVYHSEFDSKGNLTSESHDIGQPNEQTAIALNHDQIVDLTHQLEQNHGQGVEAAFRGMPYLDQVRYAQEIQAVNSEDILANPKVPSITEQDVLSTADYPSHLTINVNGSDVYSGNFDAQQRQIYESHVQ